MIDKLVQAGVEIHAILEKYDLDLAVRQEWLSKDLNIYLNDVSSGQQAKLADIFLVIEMNKKGTQPHVQTTEGTS